MSNSVHRQADEWNAELRLCFASGSERQRCSAIEAVACVAGRFAFKLSVYQQETLIF